MRKYIGDILRMPKSEAYIPMDSETIYEIFTIDNAAYTLRYASINTFMQKLRESSMIQFLVVDKAYNNRSYLMEYVRRILYKERIMKGKGSKSGGIHVVMESAMRSELYFHEYMKYIKEAIVNFNREYGFEEDQKLEIKSMTGSNYHSLIMFLHASDLHETVIEEEVWKLKSLIILHD